MGTTPTSWQVQRIFNQTYKNVADTEVKGRITDLKTCNVSMEQENVYTMGGVGNPYLGAFSHSKRVTGEASAATFKNEIMGLITGTDPVTGAATIPYSEILTVTSDAATSTYTAIGTAGAEITGCFVYNSSDETLSTEYTQAGSVGALQFTYTPGTKAFAFNTAELADDTQIIVFYNYTSGTGSQTLSNKTDTFSAIVRIEMDTLVQDCFGNEYYAVLIIYKAKLSGSWAFDLAADGDPASLDVSFEAMKMCGSTNKFWDLIIVDPPA